MTETEIRSIALFFFYAVLDDRRIVDPSVEALQMAKEKLKKEGLSIKASIVAGTSQVWSKLYGAHLKFPMSSMQDPPGVGVDLGPWREFHKNATSEEIAVVIWCKILGYSETDVANGLALPEGTVRYRLSHALRKLGGMMSQRPRLL